MNQILRNWREKPAFIWYDKDGKLISERKGTKDAQYVKYEDIPQDFITAIISIEDKKFYRHHGVDFKAVMRAVKARVTHGRITQGGSTITMQLAKLMYLNPDDTWQYKVEQMFLAIELEGRYSKEKILEFYLNNVYFANGYYGIEAAARGYFGKSCQELSLGQLCFLCSIPNNPTLYNPLKNFDNTVKRKNRILDQMLDDGVITKVDYDEAYQEEIKLNIQEVQKRDYIQTFVSYCAIRELMKKNGFEFKNSFADKEERETYETEYDDAYSTAQQMLLNKGYKIYTSFDLKKQKKLQKAVNHNLSGFKDKETNGTYKMQGSAVCIDNKTGRVVALVGGRSQETEGLSLNRAYQSYRQPGSSIKPLIVYTPTLERGSTASTTVHDYKFKGGPSNSSGRYYGYVSLRFAVEQSLNTVAWQLFEKLKPEVGLQYLLDMNYSKIVKSDYYLSASLGGLTYGTSTLEMASGYATLENDGKYREPTCIVKILDSDGNEIVSDKVEQKSVYKKDSAHAMVDILTGVIKRGTARGLGLDNGQPSAGKTGTTNDKKDGWFCGFTPYYTTAVWVGYDSPKTVADLYGSTYPGRIWHEYMNEIHKDLDVKEFDLGELSSGSSGGGSSSDYTTPQEDTGSGGSVDTDPADSNDNDVDVDPDDGTDTQVTEPPATQAPATQVPATAEPAATEPPADPAADPATEGTE